MSPDASASSRWATAPMQGTARRVTTIYKQLIALRQLLLAQGHVVKMALLILGNDGSITKAIKSFRQNSASPGRPSDGLLIYLSDQAVHVLHRIIKTRRQLEHASTTERLRPDPP